MGVVINDAELAELQSLYPLNNFKGGFTRQQEQFMLYHIKGLPPEAAAQAAGYTGSGAGSTLLKDERIQQALGFLRERHFNDVTITRELLNTMLIEAHSHATNTLEEVAAIKELGKMNDLYADAKHRGTNLQINVGSQVKNVRQLEKLDEQQLLELASGDDDAIVLDPAEYKRIEPPKEDDNAGTE